MAETSAAAQGKPGREPERGIGHERADAHPRAILVILGGLLAAVAAVLGAISTLYPEARHDLGKDPAISPPAPRLQVSPEADMAGQRGADRNRVSALGWADRSAGIARIPVEDAMRIVAARGLPDWPAQSAVDAPSPR